MVDIPEAPAHDIVSLAYTDISVITKYEVRLSDLATTKVGSDQAVEIQNRLLDIAEEIKANGDYGELDWTKIRDLEFQEKSREKSHLMKSLRRFDCEHCPDLVDHVFYVYI